VGDWLGSATHQYCHALVHIRSEAAALRWGDNISYGLPGSYFINSYNYKPINRLTLCLLDRSKYLHMTSGHVPPRFSAVWFWMARTLSTTCCWVLETFSITACISRCWSSNADCRLIDWLMNDVRIWERFSSLSSSCCFSSEVCSCCCSAIDFRSHWIWVTVSFCNMCVFSINCNTLLSMLFAFTCCCCSCHSSTAPTLHAWPSRHSPVVGWHHTTDPTPNIRSITNSSAIIFINKATNDCTYSQCSSDQTNCNQKCTTLLYIIQHLYKDVSQPGTRLHKHYDMFCFLAVKFHMKYMRADKLLEFIISCRQCLVYCEHCNYYVFLFGLLPV